MAGSLDSRKALEWRRRLERFQGAHQSIAGFCRKEGVSAPSFYQWRKRLAQQSRSTEEAPGFRPVRLVSSASVAVELPGGTQLSVPTSDPEALRLVIETLARVDARRVGGNAC